MDCALEVKGLRKQYSNFTLENFNLALPKGSIMGLIGENGAGKSTAFKTILGLAHKDAGSVKFFGTDFRPEDKELKEMIGVVFDGNAFQELLTPKQLGNIAKQAYKQWDMKQYQNYLSLFKLAPNKKVKDLSKGMGVKLSLALALSHNAKLLILDEPTSGLDPVVRDEILDVFLDFVQDENHSILISSHITTDLEKVADYITFLHEGKILMSKEKDELIEQYGILRCKESTYQKLDRNEMIAYKKEDYQWNVLVKNRRKLMQTMKNAVIDKPTIDEIMLLCVKGERV